MTNFLTFDSTSTSDDESDVLKSDKWHNWAFYYSVTWPRPGGNPNSIHTPTWAGVPWVGASDVTSSDVHQGIMVGVRPAHRRGDTGKGHIAKLVIFENNGLTIGVYLNAIENLYALLLTEFRHRLTPTWARVRVQSKRKLRCAISPWLFVWSRNIHNFQNWIQYIPFKTEPPKQTCRAVSCKRFLNGTFSTNSYQAVINFTSWFY